MSSKKLFKLKIKQLYKCIYYYLISCRFEEDSLIVGKVALNLSVGLKCRRVRLDNFHTKRCLWATVHSLLYLSSWLTTMPRQLTKLLDGICKIKLKYFFVKSSAKILKS